MFRIEFGSGRTCDRVSAAHRGKRPHLVQHEGQGGDDRDGDQLRPVEPGAETGRVVEERRRQREGRAGMHQQRQDAKTDGLAEHTDREEREVLREPPGMRRATEGPPAIDLEVPQVGDEKRNGGEDVIPADVEVGQGEVQEDAVFVRPQLVADDDDQQIDDYAGRTDDAESEQQAPVVRMADEDEVSKTLNDRTSIPTQPSREAAVLLATEDSGALGTGGDECGRVGL